MLTRCFTSRFKYPKGEIGLYSGKERDEWNHTGKLGLPFPFSILTRETEKLMCDQRWKRSMKLVRERDERNHNYNYGFPL